MASTLGYRNRAGAPLTGVCRAYNAQLALRFLAAAQEVMQRVVAERPDLAQPSAEPTTHSGSRPKDDPVVLDMAQALSNGLRQARPR